jgi:Protein of unknown function (DUF3040).
VTDDSYRAGSIFSDVVLSEYEREVLARLAAGVDDPWLASQLLGGVPAPPRRTFSIPSCWVGIVLLLLGAALSLATFTRSVWAAGVGLVVMSIGAALLVAPQLRMKRVRPLVRPVAERGQWAPKRARDWLT